MAAIARETKNIRLTSATTVLGSADPVRVFEDFATVDLISGGRAEIIAGRGAFTESFPLFGYDFDHYHERFEECLQLLMELNRSERITWQGQFRSSLNNSEVAPRPKQAQLPIWRGVGGTPTSAVRAGQDGLDMVLTILAGHASFGEPLVAAYREAAANAGHDVNKLKIAIASHGYIGETRERAVELFHPYYANYVRTMLGRTVTSAHLEASTAENNAMGIGSPEDIVAKIVYQYERFGHDRHFLQMDINQPNDHVERAIELYATKVIPAVREAIAEREG